MGNEVLVSIPSLPDDHLGVKHDEPAEDGQPNVQMSLEQQLGPKEDVEESEEEEGGESGEESATKIEILPIRSKKSCAGEAGKDGGGEHEGGRH